MSPTLLDVIATTGLPVKGKELPILFSLLARDLGIQYSKSIASYLAFLTVNAKSKGLVSNDEHHAFLLYWLCKYFICMNSVAIIFEYSYYVAAIVFVGPLPWALCFGFFYKGFFIIIEWLKSNEDIKIVLRPLCFLPL